MGTEKHADNVIDVIPSPTSYYIITVLKNDKDGVDILRGKHANNKLQKYKLPHFQQNRASLKRQICIKRCLTRKH